MTNEGICDVCGTAFIKNSNSQKYCGTECARIAKNEQDHNARFKYRMTWGRNDRGNGTGKLGKHRNESFEEERIIVKNELKRCGLV